MHKVRAPVKVLAAALLAALCATASMQPNTASAQPLTAAPAAAPAPTAAPTPVDELPREWIDPDTGHRVIRISTEPGTQSMYFHQNSYTPQGDLIVVNAPSGIQTINLHTWAVRTIVPHATASFVARHGRTVFFLRPEHPSPDRGQGQSAGQGQDATLVFSANIDTGRTRRIGRLARGAISSINADETLLLGSFAERDMPIQTGPRDPRAEAQYAGERRPDGTPYTFAEAKERRLHDRLMARIPMQIFTMNIATGEVRTVLTGTDWFNHLQFSPTDPNLIMFCHEGPWHEVDRIWTIHTDGSGLRLIHQRTMNMEIAGHEFFSPDGNQIFYDLQTPRGQVFWLASYDLRSGERIWRHMERNEWSVHFNVSRDETLFSGDGGDSEMVAHAPDGKWLYLFHPQPIPDVADIHAPNAANLIRPGLLVSERLVNMHNHDYRLEPNMTFTPDGKWIIFRSNMQGPIHTYAVELARAQGAAAAH